MNKKEKRTTLFNKNHIVITRIDNVTNLVCGINSSSTESRLNNNSGYVIKKRESPLGFYYYKRTYVSDASSYSRISRKIIELPNRTYMIVYMSDYESKHVNREVRPWEIHPDDKPMAEHFIHDLKNVIDSILDDMTEYKSHFKLGIGEYRNSLYETFFGDKRGIRFQTDSEKILSHGFDLKESFRKRKEQ